MVLFAPMLTGQAHARRVARPHIDRVAVPAGAFMMGSDDAGEQDERPRHSVRLARFAIDRLEVSRAAYGLCVQAGACDAPQEIAARFDDPRQPVVGVSWSDARSYCAWAGGRLPTEEEWEKAARGTDARTYAWGNDPPTPDRAVFGRDDATGAPDPVGSHPTGAGPYGALDLTGNVWEWTESPYDPYAYRHPARPATCETALEALRDLRDRGIRGFTGRNPLPSSCERVLRGGAWNYGAAGLRVTNRVHHPPQFRIRVAGFRCAANGT